MAKRHYTKNVNDSPTRAEIAERASAIRAAKGELPLPCLDREFTEDRADRWPGARTEDMGLDTPLAETLLGQGNPTYVRILEILDDVGIITVRHVLMKKESELLLIRNLGAASIKKIRKAIEPVLIREGVIKK